MGVMFLLLTCVSQGYTNKLLFVHQVGSKCLDALRHLFGPLHTHFQWKDVSLGDLIVTIPAAIMCTQPQVQHGVQSRHLPSHSLSDSVSKRQTWISDLPDSKPLTLLFWRQLEIKEAAKLVWEQQHGHVLLCCLRLLKQVVA